MSRETNELLISIDSGLDRIQELLCEILEEMRKPQATCTHRFTYDTAGGTRCAECAKLLGSKMKLPGDQ